MRPRQRWLLAVCGLAAAGLVLLVLAATAGPDRTDPVDVGETFLRESTAGHGSACELASQRLRTRHGEACTDRPGTGDAVVEVLFARTCGDRTLLGARLHPHGPDGQPYALLGLARTPDGQWEANSLLGLSERAAVRPGRCIDGGEQQ